MASNTINAFEGKLLEALNILPQMDKTNRAEALRLFAQTAQFFHLQQEQEHEQQQNQQQQQQQRQNLDPNSSHNPPYLESKGCVDDEALISPLGNEGSGDDANDLANAHPASDIFASSGLGEMGKCGCMIHGMIAWCRLGNFRNCPCKHV